MVLPHEFGGVGVLAVASWAPADWLNAPAAQGIPCGAGVFDTQDCGDLSGREQGSQQELVSGERRESAFNKGCSRCWPVERRYSHTFTIRRNAVRWQEAFRHRGRWFGVGAGASRGHMRGLCPLLKGTADS